MRLALLQRVAAKLTAWNQDGSHEASLQRLRARLETVCAVLPAGAERASCDKLLKPVRGSA